MHKTILIIAAAATMSAPIPALATQATAPSHQPGSAKAAASTFVEAFNALDRSLFDPLFADDVTLFFPSGPFEVRRVEGKAQVLKSFGMFFDAAKARQGKLNIAPKDLHVQDYGDVAIATFHLGNDEVVGRRTLVLRKIGPDWKIVHLHASSQPLKKQG